MLSFHYYEEGFFFFFFLLDMKIFILFALVCLSSFPLDEPINDCFDRLEERLESSATFWSLVF